MLLFRWMFLGLFFVYVYLWVDHYRSELSPAAEQETEEIDHLCDGEG